jgi:hypothetical protein
VERNFQRGQLAYCDSGLDDNLITFEAVWNLGPAEIQGFNFASVNSEHPPTRGACENNPIYMGYFSLPQMKFKPMI